MIKRIAIAVLFTAAIFTLSACASAERTGSAANDSETNAENFESVEGERIKMTAGGLEVYITLNGSKAAAELYNMLPLEMELIERNGFAKGMTLPKALDTDEETTRDYEIGDFGYWAAGPDLAIFYNDIYERTIVPVIPIGKAEYGAGLLANASGSATLEALTD